MSVMRMKEALNSSEHEQTNGTQETSQVSLDFALVTIRALQDGPMLGLFPRANSAIKSMCMSHASNELLENTQETSKDLFQVIRESAASYLAPAVNSRKAQNNISITDPVQIKEIVSNESDAVAALIVDNQQGIEAVALYALDDFYTKSARNEVIHPFATLQHPVQHNCGTIAWSTEDPTVLAVGCSDGVLLWHARLGFPETCAKSGSAQIKSEFYAFEQGLSVDCIRFSNAHRDYFACSASGSGKTKVYSRTLAPSSALIATLTTNRGHVGQLEWSEDDSFLSVQYHYASSVDVLRTSTWEMMHWKFNSNVEHTSWFTENNCQKLAAVTQDAVTILNFSCSSGNVEQTLLIENVNFAAASLFRFFPQSKQLLSVHGSLLRLHSLLYEHSQAIEMRDLRSARLTPKKRDARIRQSIIFMDDSQHIFVMQPEFLL